MSDAYDCRHARLAIGGEPRRLPPEAERHIAGCAACAKFHAETLAMEARLRAALELPLHRFRKSAAPVRRFAVAASLLLAVLLGGGLWLFRPDSALAREVIEHVEHEPGSWSQSDVIPVSELAAVLARAGVRYDSRMPVVYASPCPFRGRIVPHLVVQTAHGPMTVMVLAHEKLERSERFSADGYRGILLPAGSGSVALVTRGDQAFDDQIDGVVKGVR